MVKQSIPEEVEQAQLFTWAEYASGKYPVLKRLHHIPNGGRRDKVTAAKLKAQGVKAGVPDIFLPVAKCGYHGLYIEMKRADGGTVSKEQKAWIAFLKEQGYRVEVCHGMEQAQRVLIEYLGMEVTI